MISARSHSKTIALYLVAIIALSTSAPIIRWSEGPPLTMGFWRLLLASTGLFCFVRRENLKNILQKNLLFWSALTGFLFFLHLWTFFKSAQTTATSHCMLLFATNPIWTAILSALIHKDRPNLRFWLAFLFAFSGILILFFTQNSSAAVTLQGDFLALLTAVLFSFYLLTAHKIRRHLDNFTFTACVYLFTALSFGAVLLFSSEPWLPPTQKSWLGVAGTIIFPTFLGHAIFTALISRMKLYHMSMGKLAEPLIASFFAWLIFSESVATSTWFAFAFTITGLFILFSQKIESVEPE